MKMRNSYKIPSDYRKLFVRYVGEYFPLEKEELLSKTDQLYASFKMEAPDIGGSKNMLASNLDMGLSFFALYEASGRRIAGSAVEKIMDWRMEEIAARGNFMDANRPWVGKMMDKVYTSYAKKVERHKAKGEWGNTWGMRVNPENHQEGFAFHLVGCPLVDFAKKHDYMELMPYVCASDYKTAGMMHAKLIRKHTVAEGHETCDYWYVGDKSQVADKEMEHR